MRPERDNIAAPVLPGRIQWLGVAEPPDMAALTARGPVLVAFLDLAQLNCVRSLPYLREWHRRYQPLGLEILCIHSPRFGFTGDRDFVTGATDRLDVGFPVAIDADYAIWHDYDPGGWPSLFLWGRGGALRWAHFGEGEYAATEQAIQEDLREEDVTAQLPPIMAPVRATDEPGTLLPVPTPELFPGGSPAKPWTPAAGEAQIDVTYEGAGAWLVSDGAGRITTSLDGVELAEIEIERPGLTQLTAHDSHESHSLSIDVGEGLRVWAVSFEPGIQ